MKKTHDPNTEDPITDDPMTDEELDLLLSHASPPPAMTGASQRVLARIARETRAPDVPSNVIPLRRPQPRGSRLGWLAGLPLAASLALGLYLGSAGGFESYLPGAAAELLAGGAADETLTGIEDIESFSEDELS